MRKYIVLFYLSVITIGFSQNPEIKSDLPTVIPPAPTVAALMKFEEFPVSNYTGIPDISIPFFDITTISKEISLNVALKYHSGVGANDVASDTGLGWSLFAGGSVSRTVKGHPDELLLLDTSTVPGKVGIHHHNFPNHSNNYYQITENYIFENQDDLYNNLSLNSYDKDLISEFLWSTREMNRYDTEHDLWQFNFMGKTGRFYIKKNIQSGDFEIKPLDDYRLKVHFYQTTVNSNTYVPDSFVIFDENGFKYIFNVKEKSKTFSAIESHMYGTNVTQSTTSEREHISAIHLSEVYDNNNNLLIRFNYSDGSKECTVSSTWTSNEPMDSYFLSYVELYPCMNEFPPLRTLINSFNLVSVMKLESIDVVNKAKVTFNYESGRNDTNIGLQGTAKYLKSLSLYDLNQVLQKKFEFVYDYSTLLQTRMMLKEIKIFDKNLNPNKGYEFFYVQNPIPSGYQVAKDSWGFLNLIEMCRIDTRYHKNPTPSFSDSDLLQKILYPTGGSVIFDYEANTYSFEGNSPLTNYSDNPNNFIFQATQEYHFTNSTMNNIVLDPLNPNSNASIQLLNFSAIAEQKITVHSDVVNPQDILNTQIRLTLLKRVNNQWEILENLNCPDNFQSCCFDFILAPGVQYALKREVWVQSYNGPTSFIGVDYYNPNPIIQKFCYGGGNRIKRIGYFKENVAQDYYQLSSLSILPEKEKNYVYQMFDDFTKSSGSLVYKKPVFSAHKSFRFQTRCDSYQPMISGDINYKSVTTNNYLTPVKTQGSDVGYKNVTVFELGNGKTQYEYSSPVDYPETINELLVNHIPSKNIDFKRGLLLNESVYSDSRILRSTNYEYTFVEFLNRTGLKIYRDEVNDFYFQGSYFKKFSTLKVQYDDNIDIVDISFIGMSPSFFVKSLISFHCGDPFNQRNFRVAPIEQMHGWAKLTSTETKNYFYDASNTQSEVVTREFFEYNPLNKMIANHQVISPEGEETNTSYSYLTDPAVLAQNRIAEIERIEVQKNGELLQTSQIEYSNTFQGNASYLPQRILTAKGNQALASKVRYNRYDAYGNPLEVQQEDGMLIAYIWGYNHTQVVAKIENCSYQAIPANLITALHQATATGSELDVLTALDNLRNAPGLSQAMVTTVTHIPLVGMSTLTDPKGVRIKYHYDAMNRLEKVTDHFGNIVTENSYNYRP
ncbi:hypothetical protein [Flavobacterium sp.]|uniref:hypothetical protein n=2 Tax=Flavobacterium sp. TaxID=239 RepID=UPI0022C21D7C|nr:hypothetical protein [Flavobacterium sp.]MCZ8146030.1 hypothetical protein [Flavobacterium sp.]MCZ8366570.1 hypothetical protein [Flavobacterium sp.]